MSTGTPTADGISFGPTTNGTHYISLYYHRHTSGGRPDKNYWHYAFLPPAEYSLFSDSEDGEWSDGAGHFWGVRDQGKLELGLRGERLAKFPCPSNNSDPRHGYPVSPQLRATDTPPDDVIQKWIDDNVIGRTFGARIRRRKI